MDDDGGGDVMGVVPDLVEEVESWLCGGWHSVVGPGREPEVGDVARHKPLRKGEKRRRRRGKVINISLCMMKNQVKTDRWIDRQTDGKMDR